MNRTGTNITAIPHSRYLTNSLINFISLFAEIVKIKITVLVSLTTALGYFLGVEKISLEVIYPVIGIFILACGSAALNQYQERDEDLLMNRTKNRPIPSDRITPGSVLFISLVLLIMGSFILILKTNLTTLIIGLLAFFWYNGIYTPLKKKMVFAIIPGSIVGALPPLAGWAATGSNVFDINILIVAFYFFVWQIPHFWLLLLIYGKDYERGGFPVLTNKLKEKTIVGITFIMLVVTIIIAAILPGLNIINFSVTSFVLWIFCLIMFLTAFRFLNSDFSNKRILKTFVGINIFTLLLIILLSFDKIIYLKF
jgi:protoheme IX farnesyltransferase